MFDLQYLEMQTAHQAQGITNEEGIKRAKVLYGLTMRQLGTHDDQYTCLFKIFATHLHYCLVKDNDLYVKIVGYIKEFSAQMVLDKNSIVVYEKYPQYFFPAIGSIVDILTLTYKVNQQDDVLEILLKIKKWIDKFIAIASKNTQELPLSTLQYMSASLCYHLDLIRFYNNSNKLLASFLSKEEFYIHPVSRAYSADPPSPVYQCMKYLIQLRVFFIHYYESMKLRQEKSIGFSINLLNVFQETNFIGMLEFILSDQNQSEKFRINQNINISWNIYDKLVIEILKALNICQLTIDEFLSNPQQALNLELNPWNNDWISFLNLKKQVLIIKIKLFKFEKIKPYIKENESQSHLEGLVKALFEIEQKLNSVWNSQSLREAEQINSINLLMAEVKTKRATPILSQLKEIKNKFTVQKKTTNPETENKTTEEEPSLIPNIYLRLNQLIIKKLFQEAEQLCLTMQEEIQSESISSFEIYYHMCLGDTYFSWAKELTGDEQINKEKLRDFHYKKCISLIDQEQTISLKNHDELSQLRQFLLSSIESEKTFSHQEAMTQMKYAFNDLVYENSEYKKNENETKKSHYYIQLPDLVESIIKKIEEKGYKIYLVGGQVRDHIAKKPSDDYDFVTDAPLLEVKEIIGLNGRIVGLKHPIYLIATTITIQISSLLSSNKNRPCYTCFLESGILATQFIAPTIEEDASHRDFTCNAIYYDHTKKLLLDPYDGRTDLNNRKINFISNPIEAIKKDPILIFRAIRLYAKYHVAIPSDVLQLIERSSHFLKSVPGEKINFEITKSFSIKNYSNTLRFFKKFNLFKICFDMTDFEQYETVEFLKKLNTQSNYYLLWSGILHSKFEKEIVFTQCFNTDPKCAVDKTKSLLKKYGLLDHMFNEMIGIWMIYHVDSFRRNDLFNNIICTSNTHQLALEYTQVRLMAMRARQGKAVGHLKCYSSVFDVRSATKNSTLKEQLLPIKMHQKGCKLFCLKQDKNLILFIYGNDLSESSIFNYHLTFKAILDVIKLLKKMNMIAYYTPSSHMFKLSCNEEADAFKIQSMLEKYLSVGVFYEKDLSQEYNRSLKLSH